MYLNSGLAILIQIYEVKLFHVLYLTLSEIVYLDIFFTFRDAIKMISMSQQDADKDIIGLSMLWTDLRNNLMSSCASAFINLPFCRIVGVCNEFRQYARTSQRKTLLPDLAYLSSNIQYEVTIVVVQILFTSSKKVQHQQRIE